MFLAEELKQEIMTTLADNLYGRHEGMEEDKKIRIIVTRDGIEGKILRIITRKKKPTVMDLMKKKRKLFKKADYFYAYTLIVRAMEELKKINWKELEGTERDLFSKALENIQGKMLKLKEVK